MINDNSMTKILSEINFKIEKKLGEGMFSTVKLGLHSLINEQVAIKILKKTKISKIEDKERINREIEVMKRVNHFNIAKLYSVVETKLTIYLIQEYVQGKEFLEYLNKKGKLKESEACKFFHQIISGLDYLHQCGISHRDFKPENILLTNNNQILKIIDFGLSNTYKKGELLKTACGSPCYVPPEMIKEEKYDGSLSDIWSAGIILYLMLCGKLPFYDDDNQILYEKILSGKYDTPEYLSENAKDILSKILEIEPKKRINFEEIKSHPWFSLIDKNYLIHKGIIINEDIIPIDEDIIQKMEKLGMNNKVEIRYNIIKNYHNKITTIYNLLLKKKIDNNQKSISDMYSDIYDEYINDKKNKIEFYGNLEKAIKNRIGDNKEIINNIQNWPENKYDNNNENIIIGDSGSVIERLIKAGKFTYDEENMCLNRVTNYKQSNLKENNNNDGDSKFKTISSMKENNNNDGDSKFKTISSMKENKNKFKKINAFEDNDNINRESKKNKKAKVHFKINTDENNNKAMYRSPNPKKLKMKNTKKNDEKEKNEEEEDWYKEIEQIIDLENRRMSERVTRKKRNEIKEAKTISNIGKPKKNKEEKEISPFNNEEDEDEEEEEEIDEKKKLTLSTNNSKTKLKKPTSKKNQSKFANMTNDDKNTTKKYKSSKSSKTLTRDIKKQTNLTESSNNKNANISKNKTFKTAKTNKTIQIIKKPNENKIKNGKRKEKSEEKIKDDKKPNKKINVDNLAADGKRNQSAQKRKIKIII